MARKTGGAGAYQNHDLICIFSTYIFDQVKTSHFWRFLQVLARSACMFLTFLLTFGNFFFKNLSLVTALPKLVTALPKYGFW